MVLLIYSTLTKTILVGLLATHFFLSKFVEDEKWAAAFTAMIPMMGSTGHKSCHGLISS